MIDSYCFYFPCHIRLTLAGLFESLKTLNKPYINAGRLKQATDYREDASVILFLALRKPLTPNLDLRHHHRASFILALFLSSREIVVPEL
ncbi:hypothetical protein TMatcc_004537 [Talaromyces marneffei ATCC 18224]